MDELRELEEKINILKQQLSAKAEAEASFIKMTLKQQQSRVKLCVGGTKFETSRCTLTKYPRSMLESLVSGRHEVQVDKEGYIFIDRDGALFRILLNSMRNGKLTVPPDFLDFDLLAAEIDYFQLPFPVAQASIGLADMTRRELTRTLMALNSTLNLSGIRLCGLDLSNLIFPSSIVFNKTNFTGAILKGVTFSEQSRLLDCIMVGADLTGVRLVNVNCTGTDFTQAILTGAYLQSANLTNCIFDHCTAGGTNFSNTLLTNAKFRNVSCTKANFTSANFGGSDRRGTDFSSTNLSNASGIIQQ